MSESAWKAEHGKAVALMEEAKEISKAGFPDGMESQERFKAKMQEADDHIERARLIKEADEKLAEVDRLEQANGAAAGTTVVGGQGIVADHASRGNGGAPVINAGTGPGPDDDGGRRRAQRLRINEMLYRAMGSKALGVIERMERETAFGERETAAMGQSTNSNGGFLVVPKYAQDMFATVRRQGNTLARLGWVNRHPTEKTDLVLIPKGIGALQIGIVPELTAKPVGDISFGQITVAIFTLAGIFDISKQLARNADPAVVDILIEDLAALLGNAEEQMWLNGTGSNQPRGVMNTSGTAALPAPTQALLATGGGTGPGNTLRGQDLIDAMIDAIAVIKGVYFRPATGVLMRPLRLAGIQKAKDANGNYLINSPGNVRAPSVLTSGVASATLDTDQAPWDFLGTPVATSQNVPNTLGGGANQDPIIVGAWNELHVFDSMDPTLDSTDLAGDNFSTNKVSIRLEEMQGSTAERYPGAFCAFTGTAMTGA